MALIIEGLSWLDMVFRLTLLWIIIAGEYIKDAAF